MKLNPLAGTPASDKMLINIPKLITAYYTETPDVAIAEQMVAFGTSGHRGSSFTLSFNETHVLAICQAICLFRRQHNLTGPLFLGIDTHALSQPAAATALEVLAANGVDVMLSENDEYVPTPAVSLAILCYNKGRKGGLSDGIIITPSHNPPQDCGIKYNQTTGGPAEKEATSWIEAKANELIREGLKNVKRIPYSRALHSSTTHRYNYLQAYVNDLESVIDMQAISASSFAFAVDPLGGAGVNYWKPIKEKYNVNLTVVSDQVDPTFRFMSLDWDGQIRMDPSSPYAMQKVIPLKEKFKVAFSCDTDHDRHGIITATGGLLPSNHYFSAAIFYLFNHRPHWPKGACVGKTVVGSSIINRIAAKLGRGVYEVPVGFKWFVEGLFDSSLAVCGEESAGAAFLRRDGTVWTTEKDGIIAALLAAEMTARMGKDPAELYNELTKELGAPLYGRVDAPATLLEKQNLLKLSPDRLQSKMLAGEKIEAVLTKAPGNGAPIGGIKVIAANGWFAARPSGTENIYKIYAESFLGQSHLDLIFSEAESIVNKSLNG